MDLNIYAERNKPFDIEKFKEYISLFLLRNQIKSGHSSSYFKSCFLTLNTIVKENILSKNEIELDQGIEEVYKKIDQFEKSELFENLETNEKCVFSCLLNFTKQYIKILKNNQYYYQDHIIHFENVLMKTDIQEMFNFSKHYFSLSLKNKKLSFDNIVHKEIEKFETKYGFKDIFFRKSLNMRDKIILLKNLDTLSSVLDDIAKDFNISPDYLSLKGLISISFEPTILGYSSTLAYMNKLEDTYVISLGKYDNLHILKESYLHEFAHCLDYTRYQEGDKITYSEQAIINIKTQEPQTPVEKIMHNELGFENYQSDTKIKYDAMLEEVFTVLKEEFNIKGKLNFHNIKTIQNDITYIVNNFYKLDTWRLCESLVTQALVMQGDYIHTLDFKKNKIPNEQTHEKALVVESKIQEIRNKYCYVVSSHGSFFLHDNKKELLLGDLKENKHYYKKPLEIFARAFETYYKKEKCLYYNFVEETDKEEYRLLLKEAIEYMVPNHNNTLKRVMK